MDERNPAAAHEQEEPRLSTAMVFEDLSDESLFSAAPDPVAEKPASVSAVGSSAPEPSAPAPEEKTPVIDPLAEEDRPHVFVTYVPRFTEASEHYYMKDDPNAPPLPKEEKPSASRDAIDPTAEIDSVLPEENVTTVDTSSQEQPAEASALRVLKFSVSDPQPSEAPAKTAPEEEENIPEPSPEQEEPVEDPLPPPAAEPAGKRRVAPEGETFEYREYEDEESETCPPDGTRSAEKQDGKADKRRTVGEFTALSERDSLKDSFLDRMMSIRIRLIGVCLLGLFALFCSLLPLFGGSVSELFRFSGKEYLISLLDLQFAVAVALLSIPEILRAVRAFLHKKFTPELSLLVALLPFTAYGWYCCLSEIQPAKAQPVFSLLYAVSAAAAIRAHLLRVKADFLAFRVISTGAEKYVVDRKLTRSLEKENLALDGIVDESRSQTARVFKTSFVSGFSARTSENAEDSASSFLVFLVGFGSALVVATVDFFLHGGDVSYALAAFLLTYLASCPVFSLLLHKMPYYHAERACAGKLSAAIGENSLRDYASADVMTFDDTEVFTPGDVNFHRILLYGDRTKLPKAMRQMSALYMVVGGPLESLFLSSLDRRPYPAQRVHPEPDGVCGEVDGHLIDSGTASYMHRMNIEIPDEGREDCSADNTAVLYAAEDGVIYAKFLIRYSFSETFTSLLPLLSENKIASLIYTNDPCVTNALVSFLASGQAAIRVLKKNRPSLPEKTYPEISSGLATLGDKTDALSLILLSKTYVALQRKCTAAEKILGAAGALIAVLLSLFGAIRPIAVLALAALSAAGYLALHIVCRKHFVPVSDFDETDADRDGREETEKEYHVTESE